MDETVYPELYWHCSVNIPARKDRTVVNDLDFEGLRRTIITPWNEGRPFVVDGTLIQTAGSVEAIKIVQTSHPRSYYAERHNELMSTRGIADMVTDRRFLPLSEGTDYTYDLLFSGAHGAAPAPDEKMVELLCRRLPQAARILANRSRNGKSPYEIRDEYDVQDLLHALLRAYLKYSVQEDPLPKIAGAKSSRVDISIQELGVLIEVKYVHGPEDQKRLFEEYSQDLVLYAQWPHLKTLMYLIYNSSDLRDAEAFEKLTSFQEIGGKRFDVRVVLA